MSNLEYQLRWAARLSGVVLTLLLATFAIGQGKLPNVFAAPVDVQIEFSAMALMIIGYFVGWKWEVVGGVTTLAGFALFSLVEIAVNGSLAGGAFPLLALPGILFLLATWFGVSRRPRKRSSLSRSLHPE